MNNRRTTGRLAPAPEGPPLLPGQPRLSSPVADTRRMECDPGEKSVMAFPNQRFPWRENEPAQPSSCEPVYCIVGETLCQVLVWTEEEWELLDPVERPGVVEHVPGLGWVGAVLPRGLK